MQKGRRQGERAPEFSPVERMLLSAPFEMQRVLVIGCGGAGKSALGRRLADLLELPLVHLDQHYWKPGWVETPRPEWLQKLTALLAEDSWIMDGNYGGTLGMRLAAADSVVLLDLPRRTCLWGIFKRRLLSRWVPRSDMAAGCREQLSPDFVRWVWNYPRDHRSGVLEKLKEVEGEKEIFVLTSRRDVEEFVSGLDG